jgi:putative chitinase
MNLDDLSIPDKVKAELWYVMSKFGINTPERLAHFLGQCHHESGGFKFTTENTNYSEVGLKKRFNKYFKDKDISKYARNPEKIANLVYANRMGNGNEASGDGFRFRGRGYIQLTGKNNYKAFDKFVDDDIVLNPDLVATKYPLLSAAWFWDVNDLNEICDKGVNKSTIFAVTKKVNGGIKGLEERSVLTTRYKIELS